MHAFVKCVRACVCIGYEAYPISKTVQLFCLKVWQEG